MANDMDRRPTLAASDLHERVREAAFALLLTEHRPVAHDELAALVGVPEAGLATMLDELAAAGWIDRDPDGRVTGSAGLSLTQGPHALTVRGRRFRTWCAYDSLGIAAALAADAVIETACPVCGGAIELATSRGRPPENRPERLWLAEGGTDLRADFCTPTVLLCSTEHAAIWSERHGAHGQVLDLAEGADRGAETWAACAVAASVLGDRILQERAR